MGSVRRSLGFACAVLASSLLCGCKARLPVPERGTEVGAPSAAAPTQDGNVVFAMTPTSRAAWQPPSAEASSPFGFEMMPDLDEVGDVVVVRTPMSGHRDRGRWSFFFHADPHCD